MRSGIPCSSKLPACCGDLHFAQAIADAPAWLLRPVPDARSLAGDLHAAAASALALAARIEKTQTHRGVLAPRYA